MTSSDAPDKDVTPDQQETTPADTSKTADDTGTSTPRSGLGALGRGLRELAIVVVLALIISAGVRAFLGQVFVIPSASMADTVQVSDRVVAIKPFTPQRGDIIVFQDPGGWLEAPPAPREGVGRVLQFIGLLPDTSTNHLLKRIIGMPGDEVVCCDAEGRLVINGYSLDETSYLRPGSDPATIEFRVVVPADRVFVLGDNRNASRDSRCHLATITNDGQPQGMIAFVPMADIVGPAKLRVAPLSRMGTLGRPAVFDQVPDPSSPAPAKPVIDPVGVGC
ncbi:signal peptidase I [Propionibacteriaceae bacterium Y1923]